MLDCLHKEDSIEVSLLKWSWDGGGRCHASEPLALGKLTVYELHTDGRMLDAINRCLGRRLEELVDQKARTTTIVQYSAFQRSAPENVPHERLTNLLAPTVIERLWYVRQMVPIAGNLPLVPHHVMRDKYVTITMLLIRHVVPRIMLLILTMQEVASVESLECGTSGKKVPPP